MLVIPLVLLISLSSHHFFKKKLAKIEKAAKTTKNGGAVQIAVSAQWLNVHKTIAESGKHPQQYPKWPNVVKNVQKNTEKDVVELFDATDTDAECSTSKMPNTLEEVYTLFVLFYCVRRTTRTRL